MINIRAMLYLLAFPIGLMGLVQLIFAALSEYIFRDGEDFHFLFSALISIAFAILLVILFRKFDAKRIGYRDSMLFATSTWVLCGAIGGIPVMLSAHVTFTDAFFEAVSGLTTTGATKLSGLDAMPPSFLMYRQFIQWLGGLGVVIFVVAVLPMLNVGGMKLLQAETPGPVKDDKLSPRIADTAHYLWAVYIVITLSCALAYYIFGMSGFDALGHSFTTVSTGGFSTHDASFAYFDSWTIYLVADIFMVLGAINFALHFRVWQSKKILAYWQDEEARIFILCIIVLTLVVTWLMMKNDVYSSLPQALSSAAFHLISFITSTGYVAGPYAAWPQVFGMLFIFAGYLGGCSGSTAGGNKIIRNILSVKLIVFELKKLVHRRGVFSVKYQGRKVEQSVLSATIAFMSFAAFSAIVLSLALMACGLDFYSALSAVAACQNVSGPGFGVLGSNFQPVNEVGTWILSFAMILGRLEYFTVLALFVPSFWKY